jgi:hypothetical protein
VSTPLKLRTAPEKVFDPSCLRLALNVGREKIGLRLLFFLVGAAAELRPSLSLAAETLHFTEELSQ